MSLRVGDVDIGGVRRIATSKQVDHSINLQNVIVRVNQLRMRNLNLSQDLKKLDFVSLLFDLMVPVVSKQSTPVYSDFPIPSHHMARTIPLKY
jgi:hypothetical protein